MKTYNGFTPAQRRRAGTWLRRQWESGERARPTVCCACGGGGIVDGHCEDYSEPYGPHIGEFPLCFVCHLVLHSREHDLERWNWYAQRVSEGRRPVEVETRSIGIIRRIISGSLDPFQPGSFSTEGRIDLRDIITQRSAT